MAAAEGREPRIVDIRWDSPIENSIDLPEIVIIGKGTTIDTGGLTIKGGGGMRSMKKDMAGAAQALSLAMWIVDAKMPVRIRLLLPIAENSISGIALRPGDVIKARNGKTTEITNTDAEGRLLLADALVAAMESPNMPLMVVDFATLTGAARVALGNDLPAIFSNNLDALQRLWKTSNTYNDPCWMVNKILYTHTYVCTYICICTCCI
jgi:leucyl aminopeptidase